MKLCLFQIESYTHGLEADSLNYVLYSNRSAAYTRLHQNQKALDDAEMCIQINPAFLKVMMDGY